MPHVLIFLSAIFLSHVLIQYARTCDRKMADRKMKEDCNTRSDVAHAARARGPRARIDYRH